MRPSSDVFRPKLPVDPFTGLDGDQPWLVNQPDDPQPHIPRVIVVLGAPSQPELRPILTSQWSSDALVLIITHNPPLWNDQPMPTVRILRLTNALEESGGRELASLFDRAERLATQWRSRKLPYGDKRFAQLAEKHPGGDFTILEDHTAAAEGDATTSTLPSHVTLPSKPRRKSALFSSNSSPAYSLQFATFRGKPKDVFGSCQGQGAFDAIIHFLPPSLPEKEIYKRAILVTTLSVSFLSSTAPLGQSSAHADPSKPRFSPLLRSKRQSAPSTPVIRYAHLVHVLPPSPTTPPTPPSSLTPSSSSSSISSASSPRTPFLARHLSPSSTSKLASPIKLNPSSAFYIPPLDSDTPTPHLRPRHQPISSPIHARRASSHPNSTSGLTSTWGRKRLTQTIEQFLIQFTHPSQTAPSAADDLPGSHSRLVPYLLAPGVFTRALSAQENTGAAANDAPAAPAREKHLTVGEAIVLGLLDTSAKGDDISSTSNGLSKLAARAWIGETQEVAFVPKKIGEEVLQPSLARSRSLSSPAPVHSPDTKEKQREDILIRGDHLFEGLNAILSPHPYPSFQNTPLPWSSFSSGPRPDDLTIKRPAAVLPRVSVPLTPPLSIDDLAFNPELKSREIRPNPPGLQSDDSSLEKLAAILPAMGPASDAAELATSQIAKTAGTDHSWDGASGLLTPPESNSSVESSGESEYASCETLSASELGNPSSEHKPGPFILFHVAPLDPAPNKESTEQLDASVLMTQDADGKKGSLTGRIGRHFRHLTKVVTLSAVAASSMSSMAVSTGSLRRRAPEKRERDVLQPVVV